MSPKFQQWALLQCFLTIKKELEMCQVWNHLSETNSFQRLTHLQTSSNHRLHCSNSLHKTFEIWVWAVLPLWNQPKSKSWSKKQLPLLIKWVFQPSLLHSCLPKWLIERRYWTTISYHNYPNLKFKTLFKNQSMWLQNVKMWSRSYKFAHKQWKNWNAFWLKRKLSPN